MNIKETLRFRVGEKGWLILQININGIWTDVEVHELERVKSK